MYGDWLVGQKMEGRAIEVYKQTKGWLSRASVVARFTEQPECLEVYLEGEEGEGVRRLRDVVKGRDARNNKKEYDKSEGSTGNTLANRLRGDWMEGDDMKSDVVDYLVTSQPGVDDDATAEVCGLLTGRPDFAASVFTEAWEKGWRGRGSGAARWTLMMLLSARGVGGCEFENEEVMSYVLSALSDIGTDEAMVTCGGMGFKEGTMALLRKGGHDKVIMEEYKNIVGGERVRMELLEIAKSGLKGEVLEVLGGMWGDVEGEDEEDVKDKREELEDDIRACLEEPGTIDDVEAAKVLGEVEGLPLGVGAEHFADILQQGEREIRRLEGEIRSFKGIIEGIEGEIKDVEVRIKGADEGFRIGGRTVWEAGGCASDGGVGSKRDGGGNPFKADEEEEEREEGFWREVNQHQRGDDRFNAIAKHYREQGIIS
ncbi:hypothetical protein TrCOL_g13664 [Triparma columacea]|uniref:Uncharacterized protein n=1 Tax=Triparma columacea TaxID=722753 RepID=A0A9W7L4K4_9STRA|nr:hypothetical protein TrCOL_g13664 [Triparma columacea]